VTKLLRSSSDARNSDRHEFHCVPKNTIRRNLHRIGDIKQKVKTVDSGGVISSSPRRSFWHLNHVFFTGLAREAKKRETDSIESEGDIRSGSVGSGLDPGILIFPCFHLNSWVSHFLSKCHLSV